jgi:hypothetical protein
MHLHCMNETSKLLRSNTILTTLGLCPLEVKVNCAGLNDCATRFEGVGGQQKRGQFPGVLSGSDKMSWFMAGTRLPEPGQARSWSSFTDGGAPLT